MEFHKIILNCKQCSEWLHHRSMYISAFDQHLCSCSFVIPVTGTEVTMVNNMVSSLKELTIKEKATQAIAIPWDYPTEGLGRNTQLRFVSQPPPPVSQS